MLSGAYFLQQHRERLSTVSGAQFLSNHENFVRELALRQDDPTDGLDSVERDRFATFFSQCQRRYLAIMEKQASKDAIAVAMGPAVSAGQNLDGFGREAYERVSGLIGMLPAYSRMVMVGCGAFPATLLWLRDQFSKSFHLGLDLDAQCVETARKLAEIMGFNDMSFKVMDGKDYDYDGVEFVYVANQVISKKSVLNQVSRSGSVARVVVREPTRKGELLSQAIRHDLPAEFMIEDEGVESPTFLSYDLLLRRV